MGQSRNGDLGFGETAECFMNQQCCKISSVPAVTVSGGSMFESSREFLSSTVPCSSIGVSAPFLAGRWHHPLMAAVPEIDYDDVSVFPAAGATLLRNQRIHCSNAGLVDSHVPEATRLAGASVPGAVNWIVSSENGQILCAATQTDVPANCNIQTGKEAREKRRSMPTASDFDPCSSPLSASQTADGSEQLKDLLPVRLKGTVKKDEKKPKSEQDADANTRKQIPKSTKEPEQNSQDSKQDYLHVRAKRGQATNSHSLAERVRRERISERMRYLQNLVPGCDKITGKALMLDEIINYVQSLQRQVEFLSMKLATVNPEVFVDIDQILSKNNLHLVGESSCTLGYALGLSSPDVQPYGFMLQHAMQPPEKAFPSMPISQGILRNTLSLVSATPPSLLWEDEVRTVAQISPLANMGSRSPELV